VRAHIAELYKDRPDILNKLTSTQWMVPECAKILENRVGSAPLMVFHKGKQMLASMPGVPYEMKIAMEEQILPYLESQIKDYKSKIIHKTLQVTGIAESTLAILLEDYERSMPQGLHLAYLPKDGIIRLRLSSYGELSETEIQHWFDELKRITVEYMIADTDEPLEVLIGHILTERGKTIGTAESCTGGKLAALLNKHSGSSAFYKGSVVAYSNEVKENVLKVHRESLERYGAVSEQVVEQMACGAKKILNTDYAIATSGVAGPTGGTPEKPVGTVWIAWATPDNVYSECFHLGKLREQITDRACTKALVQILRILRNEK
jgi:nicotinamide-nucleotide amidase